MMYILYLQPGDIAVDSETHLVWLLVNGRFAVYIPR